MPSITTHNIFAKDVMRKLNDREKNRFINSTNTYLTFSQSHDYLFYYTFGKNSKEIRNFGHYAHRHNTQDYIINIIKNIKKNKLENNPEILAYLYGTITHYVLDSNCHPYIFYKTGVYRKKEKNTRKYFGGHNKIEKDLDAIYYKKETGKDYNQCNITKEIIGKTIFSKELVNLINIVYEDTYNKKDIGKYYLKGIKDAKIINTLVVNDRFGLKKLLYKLIDLLINKNQSYISTYSTYIKNPNTDYLNTEKKEWNHPCLPNLKYNYSFEELYNMSINKTVKIIRVINKVLYENKDINDILQYIPNLDYSTGLPIEEANQLRHFEY